MRKSYVFLFISLVFLVMMSGCSLSSSDSSANDVSGDQTNTMDDQSDGIALPGGDYGLAMGMGDSEFFTNIALQEANGIQKTVVYPGATRVYGVDVSYYQGTVNWAKVKAAGKKFAYIRYSDGSGFLDPNFTANWKNAKAAGLTVGAYQFFRPNQNPTTQADMLVNKLISLGGTGRPNLPPVIDVETRGGMSTSTVINNVNTWLVRVKSKTGRLPVLYTSPGFWNGLGHPTPSYLPYLWIAHWGVSAPNLPSPWGRLRFWQYSATGSVSGISGNVDLDLYNGSLSEMQGL